MQVRNDKDKYQLWIKEIPLPLTKIKKSGNSYVIVIPRDVVEHNELSVGTKVFPILLKREKKVFAELEKGEKWVKLTKEEQIKFEHFLEEQAEIERAAKEV